MHAVSMGHTQDKTREGELGIDGCIEHIYLATRKEAKILMLVVLKFVLIKSKNV